MQLHSLHQFKSVGITVFLYARGAVGDTRYKVLPWPGPCDTDALRTLVVTLEEQPLCESSMHPFVTAEEHISQMFFLHREEMLKRHSTLLIDAHISAHRVARHT